MKRLPRIPQQHKWTKLSNDRKNWKGTEEYLDEQEAFLANINAAGGTRPLQQDEANWNSTGHARRSHLLEEVLILACWRERRAELEKSIVELNSTRTTA